MKIINSLNRFYPALLSLILCLGCSDSVIPKHPTAKQPGRYSLQTGLKIYTHESLGEPYMQLTKFKKSYEKTILYFGENNTSGKQPEPDDFQFKYPFYPPSSLPIGETVTMDITEVANIHYLEYLNFITLDSPQHIILKYIPFLDQDLLKSYFYNPEFYFYPVVGVNQEQAEAYCRWKAQVVTQKLSEGVIEYKQKGQPKKVVSGNSYHLTGRLPTEKEWLLEGKRAYNDLDSVDFSLRKEAINYITKYEIAIGDVSSKKIPGPSEQLRILGSNLSDTKPDYLRWKIPFYIFSYKPSSTGFYNLIGNVAELVHEGYALGGSYETTFRETLVNSNSVPARDVGFRCVCEMKKDK